MKSKMKRLFFVFLVAFMLFASCSDVHDIFFDDASLTIENNTERDVSFTYVNHDTSPDFPVTVEAGSSRKIDLSTKYEDYNIKFVYDGTTYKDGFYPCGEDVTYRLYVDTDSRLKVDFGDGNGWHPQVDE